MAVAIVTDGAAALPAALAAERAIAVVPMWRRHRDAVAEVRALPAAGLVVRSASEAGM